MTRRPSIDPVSFPRSPSARPTLCGRPLPPPPTFWLALPRRTRRLLLFSGALVAAIAGLIAGSVAVTHNHAWPRAPECRWTQWHLPPGVTPAHYNLTWDVGLETGKVEGTVDARFETDAAVRCVVLHAAPNLAIASVRYDAGGDDVPAVTLPPASLRRVPATQQVIVALPAALPPSSVASLAFTFSFPLVPALSGLYLSTWTDAATNATHRLAVTQFEANAARRAVPCWDEPRLKARWTVTLVTEAGVTALTNMPIVG